MYVVVLMCFKGYDVSLFDINFVYEVVEFQDYFLIDFDFLVIYDDGFNYFSKMCLIVMWEVVLEMIWMVCFIVKYIIVCSFDFIDYLVIYLEVGVDFIIFGEGEFIFVEFVDLL